MRLTPSLCPHGVCKKLVVKLYSDRVFNLVLRTGRSPVSIANSIGDVQGEPVHEVFWTHIFPGSSALGLSHGNHSDLDTVQRLLVGAVVALIR